MAALPGSAAYAIALAEGPLVTAIELEVQLPGGTYASAGATWGELAHGALPAAAARAADSSTIRASDLGYVSRSTDTPANAVYPPTLEEGFASNRALDLSPGGAGAAVTWGELRLADPGDRRYDAGLVGRNADQRQVRILIGRKTLDAARGFAVDPAYSALAELFVGLAQQWQADERALTIPVRDQASWLERPYLQDAYDGTGGANGSADIAGRLKPRLRGGSAVAPVRNISPVLIDPVANIWQYSDGTEATITTLYEDGAAVFTSAGDTATSLWTGSVAAGAYRTNKAASLFQLGSPQAGQITCDAWGKFPGAGTEDGSLAHYAALRLLRDDMAMPTGTYDTASFNSTVLGRLYEAGWYWDGSQQESCAEAVGRFLMSANARLITKRNGDLAMLPLQPASGVPDASYSTAHIVSLRRVTLPPDVSPPLYRVRWGYARNHTLMATGVNPTVTDARRQFLRTQDRFATALDTAVLNNYRRPNDTQPIPTALLAEDDALYAAQQVMALWGTERRLYSVELPVALGLRHELGDVVNLTYPLDDLDAGCSGRVVGEQLRLSDATSALTVLV
jgi:hypothetical protein